MIKMEEEKNQTLENLREFADNWMWPLYQDTTDQNYEGLQSVPEADPTMPFLPQQSSLYPTLESTPVWMNSSQNFTNLNSPGATGESNISPYQEEPSPAPSSTGSFAFTDYAESFVSVDKHDEHFKSIIARIGVSEKTLQEFSVKELNRFLKSNGLTKEEQKCLKNRRRTLKNRGYAQNCRIKRIKVKMSLESENESLQKEIDQLRGNLAKAKKERDVYKAKLQEIDIFLKLQKGVKVG